MKRLPLASSAVIVLSNALVASTACTSHPRPVPRGEARIETASSDASEPQQPSRPAASKPVEEGFPQPCSLPDDLREADWPRRLSPVAKTEPEPRIAGATTIAVLPDTQYYVNCRNDHVSHQARWVAAQRLERNIVFAVQLGDLTEHNTDEEWRFVASALEPLQERLPLFLTTGNHDYGNQGVADRRITGFQKYFSTPGAPTRRFTATTLTPGDWENAYYRVPLGDTYLGVLVLEWSPRTHAVDWAKNVLEAHPKDRIIFITHAYLYYDGTRYDWAKYGEEQKWNPRAYGTARKNPDDPSEEGNWLEAGAFDGEMLWQSLLRDHPGVFLTLNGHVLGDGVAVLSEKGTHGNTIHQVLVNYQMLDEGGLGYLRLIELSPDGKWLRMKTFSPSLDLFATGKDQDFSLEIDPPLH